MTRRENKKVKILQVIGRRGVKIFLIVFVVLLVIRLILPFIVLHYANRTLAKMPGYYGHVQDIDIALIRGAYQLNNIYINKIDTATDLQLPFFRSDVIDLSVEWKALFHGSFVGELVFERPVLRFTKDKAEPAQVQKDTTDFRIMLKKFMPLKVNRFEVNHGIIAYRDSSRNPAVVLDMTETHILAQNLKNSYDSAAILPATVKATANLYQGHLNFDMRLNPLAKNPTFDMNAELQNTNLVDFNNFFKAYGGFDVHQGNFGLYAEMAAEDGKFKGYVKPIIKDLKVVGPEDRHDSFFNQVWEHIVGAVGVLFRNQAKDQLATKITMEGVYNDPSTGTMDAIAEALRNAFIQALMPSIDNEINLNSLAGQKTEKKGFIKKLFEKKKKSTDNKINA